MVSSNDLFMKSFRYNKATIECALLLNFLVDVFMEKQFRMLATENV